MDDLRILKVGKDSNPNSVAGALTESIKANKKVYIKAIGAASVNQAIKAIAIARGFLAPSGKEIVCIPVFEEFEVQRDMDTQGEFKTGIKLIVKEID